MSAVLRSKTCRIRENEREETRRKTLERCVSAVQFLSRMVLCFDNPLALIIDLRLLRRRAFELSFAVLVSLVPPESLGQTRHPFTVADSIGMTALVSPDPGR